MVSKLDTIDSIVQYLKDSTLSSTNDDIAFKNENSKTLPMTKNNVVTAISKIPSGGQVLPKGRIKFGPITVNPRKQPSKTLFTGRRSKYEVLSGDEEEKRRDRRERNRVAATKCREKREKVLDDLQRKETIELNNHKQLLKVVKDLEERKKELELLLQNHENQCPLMNNLPTLPTMIFGDPNFLESITDSLPLPLPTCQQETCVPNTDDEELSHTHDSTSVLTNSAYNVDQLDSLFIPQPMTTSSIDRLINTLQTPTVSMESINNNNNNSSMLFNSAIGSSCAKQHSNEEDSLTAKCTNHFVC